MKNDYDKYINEVWELKEKAYKDFKKSGKKNYIEFIRNELSNLKVKYKNKPQEKITHHD